jgi:NifU-like protein involved in Fe-S cluster formation
LSEVLNPAAEFDYSPGVRELFNNLQHAGSLAAANVLSASAGSREQGAWLQLFVEVSAARVTARYLAYGCPHFLAACESLAYWLEGRACNELSQWRWRDVETQLQVPTVKRNRLLLLDDVLQRLSRELLR